jgi:hypothetical protein
MREGVLVKMCRREPKRRYFFLFNDLLVYATVNELQAGFRTTYTFHRAITLHKCRVENIPDASSAMNNAFQVLSNQKSFTVFAESPEDKEAWIRDINKAIQLNNQLKYGSSTQSVAPVDQESADVAPVWVPDKLLKNCMLCDVKFTALNRRVSFKYKTSASQLASFNFGVFFPASLSTMWKTCLRSLFWKEMETGKYWQSLSSV